MTTTVLCTSPDDTEEEEMIVVLLVDAAVTSARVTVLMLDILGDFLSFGWAIKLTLELSLLWGDGAPFFLGVLPN